MDISPIIRLDEERLEEGVRVLREMREVKMAPEFGRVVVDVGQVDQQFHRVAVARAIVVP